MVLAIFKHKHFILERLYLSSWSKVNLRLKQSKDKKTYTMWACKSPTESLHTITKSHLINHHNLKLKYPKRNAFTECITELSTSKLKIWAKTGFLGFLKSDFNFEILCFYFKKYIFRGKHMKSRDRRIIGIIFTNQGLPYNPMRAMHILCRWL